MVLPPPHIKPKKRIYERGGVGRLVVRARTAIPAIVSIAEILKRYRVAVVESTCRPPLFGRAGDSRF